MKTLLKDALAVITVLVFISSIVYMIIVSLDEHIAIENEKELQYQEYIERGER